MEIVKQVRAAVALAAAGDLGARMKIALVAEELLPLLLNVVDAAERKDKAISAYFWAQMRGDEAAMKKARKALEWLDVRHALEALGGKRFDGLSLVDKKVRRKGRGT